MSATVGVVIPAYNAEAFIADALDSVAAQRRPPDRVVVVDDGSQDQTAAVVERWIAAHPELPVTLLRMQPNRGLSATRNRAITASETDCIATLDADDTLEPDHLARLMEPLEREKDIVLAFGDTREFSAAGEASQTLLQRVGSALRALESDDRSSYRVLRGPVFESLLPGNYVAVSATVFRRERAIAAGLYDPGLKRVEDRDFILRMARAGSFAFVPIVASRKRIHEHNISGPKYQLLMTESGFGVLLRARKWLLDGRPEERAALELELSRAAEALLYVGSVTSLSELRRVAGKLREAGFPALASQPRAWLRALWYRLTGRHGEPA